MTAASLASISFISPWYFFTAGDRRGAKAGEQHVTQRTVHGLGHQLGEQGTGGTDHGTGDDHGGVVEHETFEGHGQTGQGVIQRNDHRHVGAADRQCHHDAEGQRQGEEQEDGEATRHVGIIRMKPKTSVAANTPGS